MEIILATTNKGKLRELQQLLTDKDVVLYSLDHFQPVPDVEETGATFAENARLKACYYSQQLNHLVLADDSGLIVDALDGAPGVYSARFAGTDGPDRDQENNKKLLSLLKDIPDEKRTARFCCCLCLASPAEILIEVEGFVQGVIAHQSKGENGFGYDPIFYLPDRNKTIAQLPYEEKNQISHRGQALKKLLAKLEPLLKNQ